MYLQYSRNPDSGHYLNYIQSNFGQAFVNKAFPKHKPFTNIRKYKDVNPQNKISNHKIVKENKGILKCFS